MTEVQTLGESWQRKNQVEVSPFDLGRRVQYWRRVLKIFVYISIVSLVVLVLASLVTTGYPFSSGIPWEVLRIIVPAIFLGMAVGLYKSAYSRECLVWDEFKRHHDTLVKELSIAASSAALTDIIYRANKHLARQSIEIHTWLETQASQNDGLGTLVSLTMDETNKFHTKVVQYWRLRRACVYMGLISEEISRPPAVISVPVQMGKIPLGSSKS